MLDSESLDSAQVWFTTDEVAHRYRTSASTVRYWRRIDYGPRAVKVGRRMLYSADELRRFDTALLGAAS
ncbi:helix-turn-helix domain-containing protein [Streptomyces albogriseolus]|uniref:helix-turn-helix domain-containing protein n=1 Tax=Streptomyces albogriseolus TaxID=1887 RepID=UPI00345F802E